MKKYLGKVVDVLYCTVASDGKGMYGYTNNYIKVYLDSTNKEYLGQIVPTLIKNFNEEFLIGQAVV